MPFFNIYNFDGALFVDKTSDGVIVLNTHFTLDGTKALRNGLHVYSVDFIHSIVAFGPDYERFVNEMS